MSLRIFGTVLRHGGENEFGMGAQHGKLDVECRVEHHIGRLLIGEDPLFLGLAHALPLTDGLAGGIGTLVVVANDAAQQAVVLRGDPVVVIEGDAGQGRDVDLVFQFVVDACRE